MGNYQKFRGDPETKLFYLLNNFMGGINTEFSDDNSNDTDFESIINFDMDKLGTLNKRGGFGELTAISEIFNKLDVETELPNIKNRTELTPNPENQNDNVVYMKLLQNDNNCFRALSGFSGENAYRKYQEMYGFQQNRFKLLMITTKMEDGIAISSTAWLYQCYLPELEYEDEEPTDTETMTITCNKITLPVIFNWDRNLMNIETIEFYDKIYFTGNNKCLVTFDRSVNVTDSTTFASAFSYSGDTIDGVNSAHVPSGLEIRHIGFNVLCDDPMHSIDTQGISTDSIQGVYVCTEDNIPLLNLPLGQKFLLNIMYTGTGSDFSVEMKEGDNALSFDISPNSTLSTTGLKVYEVKFKDVPSGEVEIKITKTGATLEPYYDYYDVAQPDKEAKVVSHLNIGDYGLCEMYNRALYYKDDTIWFSEVNNFDYVPNYNYVTLPIEPTDKITKVCYFKKSYIIFTKQRIYKMINSFGESDFAVQPVNMSLGCHAGNTVIPIEDTLYFSSPRGLYALKSSTFVEGFENVKELDLKVKTLTSDFTKYSAELSDPAIRFNGVSERAYAIRYKDKYLLFYNNYNDKGDYAAVNGLDVLAYQFDIGAYTTYRFKEKPTFLFVVDNALETLATVEQRRAFTEEEVLLEYDFDNSSGDTVEDLSGNGYDATVRGGAGLNQGSGLALNGTSAYATISSFSGDIEKGFDLSIDTKCTELNGATLIDLQQSYPSYAVTKGSITTNVSYGFYAVLDYTIETKPDLISDDVSYKLTLYRDETASETLNMTYSMGNLIPSTSLEVDFGDSTSMTIASGNFEITRTAEGTYSSTWVLNITGTYVVVTTGEDVVIGADVNLTDRFWASTSKSWIQLGFREFKATATREGCTITYTPAVKNTSRLSVGSRNMTVTIDGKDYSHSIPSISGTKTTNGNSNSIYLTYTGGKNITVKFTYYVKATLSGSYVGSVSTSNQTISLPSITITPINISTTYNVSSTGNKGINLVRTQATYREIILKEDETEDKLIFTMTNEYGTLTVETDTDIGLLERHTWKVVLGQIENNNYTCTIYRDEDALISQNFNSMYLSNSTRDASFIGTDINKETYYKGEIYNVNMSNPTSVLLDYQLNEGTGTIIYDSSGNRLYATINEDVVWLISEGLTLENEGYLQLPILGEDVYFTNGFKVEFEGIIGNNSNLAKIFDFATYYDNGNNKNKNCSINAEVIGNILSFNTNSLDYKSYKVMENTVDLTERHSFILDCVDNGSTGYTLSLIIDGVIMSNTSFKYGGISNIKRNSNFIGRSNTTTDSYFTGILNNFKITIYASQSGVPIYRSALYEFDTTPTDFGKPMYVELKTKGVNMKYPQHLKKLKHIFVKVIGGYNYGELFFTLYGDGYIVNDPEIYKYYTDESGTVVQEYTDVKDLTIDERVSLLGNMRLSITRLGDGTYQTRKLVIPKKAKNFSLLTYGESSDYISFESFGFVCKLGKVKES